MDKRKDLRAYYQKEDEAKQLKSSFDNLSSKIDDMSGTMVEVFKSLIQYLNGKTTKTEVINQLDSIKTPDVQNVVKALELLDKDVLSTKIDTKPLLEAINGLKREITLIPSKMPTPKEQKDTIKVSNLNEVKLDTSALEKAIKALDLNVDVKAPIINTEKTDLEPLRSVMLDLLDSVKKQKPIEEVRVSNLKDIIPANLSNVEKKLDESNKHLKKLVEKPIGGGGGGGNGTPYVDGSGVAKNVVLTSDGKIPVEANQEQITQLLDQLIIDTQLMQRIAQSLQTVDALQRLRVTVDNVVGSTLGSSVAAGYTSVVPAALPAVSATTLYFQGVYMVGQDWRQTVTDQSNIAYNQMLERIYIS